MIDLAMRMAQPPEISTALIDEAHHVADRYQALWDALHAEPTLAFADRYQIESRIRHLHDLGFEVDEVALRATDSGGETLRLKVCVAARRYHATLLRGLTGLDVGEGQARILLGDLRAYQGRLQQQSHAELADAVTARRWAAEVLRPGMARARQAVGGSGTAVQAYCDLLEVRWLLSERAGRDVGEAAALAAIAGRTVPPESAAKLAVAEDTAE